MYDFFSYKFACYYFGLLPMHAKQSSTLQWIFLSPLEEHVLIQTMFLSPSNKNIHVQPIFSSPLRSCLFVQPIFPSPSNHCILVHPIFFTPSNCCVLVKSIFLLVTTIVYYWQPILLCPLRQCIFVLYATHVCINPKRSFILRGCASPLQPIAQISSLLSNHKWELLALYTTNWLGL